MSGIKLKIDENGEADIFAEEEAVLRCLIDHCKMVNEDWICGHSGLSIWDYYRNPGWCPLFKWFRTSRNKEFTECQRAKVVEKKSNG